MGRGQLGQRNNIRGTAASAGGIRNDEMRAGFPAASSTNATRTQYTVFLPIIISISCVFPIFSNGISSFNSSNSSGVRCEFISVFIIPGAIELILMFDGPSSFASDFVSASTPALLTL